jgi:hypothetical protein
MHITIIGVYGKVAGTKKGEENLVELKTLGDVALELKMSEEQLRIVLKTVVDDEGNCALDFTRLNLNAEAKSKLMIVVNKRYEAYKEYRKKFISSKQTKVNPVSKSKVKIK